MIYWDVWVTLGVISRGKYENRSSCDVSVWFKNQTNKTKHLYCQYTGFFCRSEPTKASALSRSVSWYCCSGPRLFPHGPFSPTRSRAEPCSLLTSGGRGSSFTVRAKWDTAGGSCLLMNRLRKAITSRVPAAKIRAVRRESTTRPLHNLWTLTCSTTTNPEESTARCGEKIQRHHATDET